MVKNFKARSSSHDILTVQKFKDGTVKGREVTITQSGGTPYNSVFVVLRKSHMVAVFNLADTIYDGWHIGKKQIYSLASLMVSKLNKAHDLPRR